jgi:hypothetical protein
VTSEKSAPTAKNRNEGRWANMVAVAVGEGWGRNAYCMQAKLKVVGVFSKVSFKFNLKGQR